MRTRSLVLSFLSVGFFSAAALAQQPAKPASQKAPASAEEFAPKLLLECPRARVYDVVFKPGQQVPPHDHPDHVLYALSDGKLKITHTDGKFELLELKAGQAKFMKADSHGGENVGDREMHLLAMRVCDPNESDAGAGEKDKSAAAKPADKEKKVGEQKKPVGGDDLDPAKVAADSTKVLLDTPQIRMLEITLKPGQKQKMHRHPGMVVYGLTGSKLHFTLPDGKSSDVELPQGVAVWRDPITHTVENSGDKESRILHFEVKE